VFLRHEIDIVSHDGSGCHRRGLARACRAATVLKMYTLGRFLQLVGLTIPPLAIIAELNERNPGLLLKFGFVAVGIFVVGYLMQRYSGGRST
jgi:hypothetical protein